MGSHPEQDRKDTSKAKRTGIGRIGVLPGGAGTAFLPGLGAYRLVNATMLVGRKCP
jgi:hypothetical protein